MRIMVPLMVAFAMMAPDAFAGLNTGAGPWQWQLPAVQGNTLNAVSFYDNSTGWVAGIGGTVLKTTDGGENWAAQPTGTLANLNGIRFVSASTGWAVGDDGTILLTTDGGGTWSAQTLPASGCSGSCSSTFLEAASFANASSGVVVGGGYAFYTANGGATWSLASGINSGFDLAAVQMISTSLAVAVGSQGAIYRSTNGGVSWSAASTPATPASYDLTAVYFVDSSRGFAVGKTGDNKGKLLRTTDGGANWSEGSDSSAIDSPLEAVRMGGSGNSVLIAAGANGAIYRREAADHWSASLDVIAADLNAGAVSSGTTSNLQALSRPSSSTFFAVGEAGVIEKTSNSGTSWSLKAGGDATSLTGISFFSPSSGLVVGSEGTVMATSDGGAIWSAAGSGIPADASLHGVHYRTADNAFAVGCQGGDCPSSGAAVAYKYNGSSWTVMSVPPGPVSLNSVHMSSDMAGWAVGSDGTVLKTSDGGTWLSNASGISASAELNSVDSTESSNGWAVGQETVGNQGVIYKYDNGTGSWSAVGTPASPPTFFTSIDMVDASTGFAVGSGGGVFKTTDGGSSWSALNSGTSKMLAAVSFFDVNHGFAVGEDGRLIHTTDGGDTWSAENLGTVISMTSISMVGERQAFTAGGNGAVLKSLRPYYFTWYDDIYADNWILVANPADASTDVWFDLFVGQKQRALPGLPGYSPGQIPPGKTITPMYPGVMSGPVNAASLTSAKAVVSQRTFWPKGGDSLEEVRGQDIDKLSDHFYWTWYDQQTPGMANWVLVANPNPFAVYYEIKIAGIVRSSGTIAVGQSFTPTFNGVMGGPVEVQTWTTSGKTAPAFVMASQRVHFNYNKALNEVPGIPAGELSDRYLWTWYDQKTPGATNWILVANPSSTETVRVEISFSDRDTGAVVNDSYDLAPGSKATPTYPGKMGGPVEVRAYLAGDPAAPRKIIASQRSHVGPSFEEVPGLPASLAGGYSGLSSLYYWTWYDQKTSGMINWVLVGNTDDYPVFYEIEIGGNGCSASPPQGTACLNDGGQPLASGQHVTPIFAGLMGGPVRVQAWRDAGRSIPAEVVASQRVMHKGYFNETLGTVLD